MLLQSLEAQTFSEGGYLAACIRQQKPSNNSPSGVVLMMCSIIILPRTRRDESRAPRAGAGREAGGVASETRTVPEQQKQGLPRGRADAVPAGSSQVARMLVSVSHL